MSLPRYPEYKDSGVEWLGEIPLHWDVSRLKRAASVFPSNVDKKSNEDEVPVHLCNYTDVYYNDTISPGMSFMPATATAEQVNKFTLRAGDTIITKDSETADDIGVSAFVPADLPGVVCGYHLSMIRPTTGVDGAYVKRLFDTGFVRSSLAVRANGLTRVGLGQYALDNLVVPLPPIDEQHAIATFLDRETAKIDALIAEQRRLLELLKEKRQAVISHAVTKGLNPDAPMKNSGVEWLGEVPAHWRVGRCQFYLEVLSGFAFPSARFTDSIEQTRLLRGINVGVSQIKWDETVYWERSAGDGLESFELKEGDLVIGMDRPLIGEGMRVAKLSADDVPCLLLQRVAALKLRDDVRVDYMQHLLASEMFVAHFAPETTGVSIPHLSPRQIAAYVIPVPPVHEQDALLTYLSAECARIDEMYECSERGIELLLERRSALVSAAVTGQVDVRSLAPTSSAA